MVILPKNQSIFWQIDDMSSGLNDVKKKQVKLIPDNIFKDNFLG